MSFDAIRWALRQELPAAEKIVLIVLADFNSKHGVCNPGKDAIMRKAGLSERAVDYKLIRLKDLGLIDYTPSKGWRPNRYRLLITPHDMQGNTPQEMQGIEQENPARGAEYPASGAENPARGAPKPVLTSKEPEKIGAPSDANGGKPPVCPHQEIIKIYHEPSRAWQG